MANVAEGLNGRSLMLYSLTFANVVLAVCHYLGLLAYGNWAAGLAWWFQPLFTLGPLVALASLILSARQPRRWALLGLNALIFVLYVLVWAPIVPHLEWRRGNLSQGTGTTVGMLI